MNPQNPGQPKPQAAQQPPLKVEFDPDMQTSYSNTAMISHTPHEFILEFIQQLPSDQRFRVVQRLIMTPYHAKLLLGALAENISRYEARFGTIPTPQRPPSLAEQLFSSVPPETPKDE